MGAENGAAIRIQTVKKRAKLKRKDKDTYFAMLHEGGEDLKEIGDKQIKDLKTRIEEINRL